jgi:3-oxoacyl-[acyl-carrier protein] reductase
MSEQQSNARILEGKNVIITGGSSGIGKALAIGFSQEGANVIIIGRDEAKLKATTDLILGKGNKCRYAVADVSKFNSINEAIQKLLSELGTIHVLINNAGLSRMKTYAKMPVELVDTLVDTNIKGVMYTTLAVLPSMVEKQEGVIINTSSIASINYASYMVAYSTTKAAVNAFTESLAQEVKSKKVMVNAILPSFVDTPLLRLGTTEEQVKMLNPIQPEELIPYYLFFASPVGKKVTGTLVNIEEMMELWKLKSKLPEGTPATWSNLEPIAKEHTNPKTYANLKSNKRIIDYILEIQAKK